MENNNKVNNFIKGLNKDTYELNQDDSSYTFALNATNESEKGDYSVLTNELGNTACLNLPVNLFPIGSILLNSDEIILFVKNKINTINQIILGNLNSCSYDVLIDSSCLNFQNQIQGVSRTLNGCDRIIYFVDGLNPDRVINIDNIIRNRNSHVYLDGTGSFDCDLIKNKRNINIANIDNITINNSGGNLDVGMYQFILQYEDTFGNGSDYFGFTLGEPIVYGNYDGDYKNIMGGDPLLFPPTNKSISFTIKDLDTTYNYVNIIVSHTKNNITSYYLVEKLSITSNRVEYTLSDITMDGTTQITYDKLIVSNNPYDVSETITQTDNRLIKGGLKGKVRDYSEFQRLATNIKVKYVTKAIKHESTNSSSVSGLSKSGTAYSDYRTYMRDEVYSLAIVYVFNDGSETPGFPIMGRAKNKPNTSSTFPSSDDNTHSRPNNNTGVTDTGWDSALILAEDINGNLLPDFKILIPSDFTIVSGKRHCERWKIYNTARRTELNTVNDEYYSKGELAFYESQTRYPNTQDCSGNYVYPVEKVNGIIVGQKIRHCKMPDTTLEEHFTIVDGVNYILPLGLEFVNIQIPVEYQDDIIGYYIVREQRTQQNKSILDKGIVYENWITPEIQIDNGGYKSYYVQSTIAGRHHREQSDDYPWIPNYSSIDTDCGSTDIDSEGGVYNHKSLSFHGPVSKFYKTSLSSTYVKIERVLKGGMVEDNASVGGGGDVSKYYRHATYNESYLKANQQTNLTIEKSPLYIEPDVEISEGYLKHSLLNNNCQSTVAFELNDEIDYISGDDSFNEGEVNVFYNSMKQYNREMYGQINFRKYYKVHNKIISKYNTTTTVFGGDCFIGKFSFFSSASTKKCDSYGNNNSNISGFDVNKTLVTYFVESEINTELRHLDITDSASKDNTFWDYFNGSYHDFLNLDWNGSDINLGDLSKGGSSPWFNGTYIKNKYLYNTDFSKSDTVKPYFSLDVNFDYCKECREEFPTRITYSEQGNQEQTRDTYRIFYVNNYRDLPDHTGKITNLFINFDELYAHTKQSLYKIVTKPYQINTDQTNLYVGTGEFFSVPPRELVSTLYGYGGSNCKWGTVTTEFGTIYVDDLTGKIFLLTIGDKGGMSNLEISNKGMKNWFDENIQINLDNQWKRLFNTEYPFTNQPGLINGIGFVTTYDPRHKRVIITKKDFKIIEENTFNPNQPFNLTDSTRFENLSWTISYSLIADAWISFHSYLPNFYFNDGNTFYSSINSIDNQWDSLDNKLSLIWKHNKGEHQKYYNIKQNFIIEYVDKNVMTTSLNSIYWISHTELFDTLLKQYSEIDNVTFQKGLVYTSSQSSGLFDIKVKDNPYENVNWSNTQKLVSRVDNNWKLSGIRDLAINKDTPTTTSKWSNLKPYFKKGYIDKVQNDNILDLNKNLYQLADIKDKIKFIRLFFTNDEIKNYKFKILLTNHNSEPSPR